MLNLLFGLLRACEFPALRTLQLVFNFYEWARLFLDAPGGHNTPSDLVLAPFDADDPIHDDRWILPKGMALALTNIHIDFIGVDDVLDLDRLVGLLGAAFRPGVVRVVISDQLDQRRTYEFCTVSMDPGHDHLVNRYG
jgi:hypothetical protein